MGVNRGEGFVLIRSFTNSVPLGEPLSLVRKLMSEFRRKHCIDHTHDTVASVWLEPANVALVTTSRFKSEFKTTRANLSAMCFDSLSDSQNFPDSRGMGFGDFRFTEPF